MTTLKVQTSEVRDLASDQLSAAQGYGATASTTSGTSSSVLITHGVICMGTSAAVASVSAARAAAALAMQTVSSGLAENLQSAASYYDQVDAQGQSALDSQMNPGGS